jgi:hypothetical protein
VLETGIARWRTNYTLHMHHWILTALFTFAGLFGGGACILLGWGVIPRKPRYPELHAQWLRQSGHLLRWVGPVLLLLGVLYPANELLEGDLPPWVWPVGLAIAVGVFLAFVVRTWQPEPSVQWPRGFKGWGGFCFAVFCWTAVISGILKSLGVDIDTDHWGFWLLAIPALVVHRGLQVWMTRVKWHAANWRQRR